MTLFRMIALTAVSAPALILMACSQAPAPAAQTVEAPVEAPAAAPAVEAPVAPVVPASVFANADGIAINGYDPVAYFTVGAPTQGVPEFQAAYNGATYYFASEENRAAFEAEPAKFAPQYGGFCAYGAVFGKKFETQPDAWYVQDGKLYLNKDKGVQAEWSKDIPGNITKADGQWPAIAEVPAANL